MATETRTLLQHLKAEGLTYEAFADVLTKVRRRQRKPRVTKMMVWRWANGEGIPRPDSLRLIEEVTGGKVPIQSFFGKRAA